MTTEDIERRWREAKLGGREGGRVCVWVECDGDPRAEVLGALARVRPGDEAAGPPEGASAHEVTRAEFCQWGMHSADVQAMKPWPKATQRIESDGMHLDVCDACAEHIGAAMASIEAGTGAPPELVATAEPGQSAELADVEPAAPVPKPRPHASLTKRQTRRGKRGAE